VSFCTCLTCPGYGQSINQQDTDSSERTCRFSATAKEIKSIFSVLLRTVVKSYASKVICVFRCNKTNFQFLREVHCNWIFFLFQSAEDAKRSEARVLLQFSHVLPHLAQQSSFHPVPQVYAGWWLLHRAVKCKCTVRLVMANWKLRSVTSCCYVTPLRVAQSSSVKRRYWRLKAEIRFLLSFHWSCVTCCRSIFAHVHRQCKTNQIYLHIQVIFVRFGEVQYPRWWR